MSGMRWADTSSDESEPEPMPVQQAGLNDGNVGSMQINQPIKAPPLVAVPTSRFHLEVESDVERELDSDADTDSDVEKETEEELARSEAALKKARANADAKKKETKPKRPITKQEKQALKAKEQDDLDNLLNDFGVDTHKEKEAETEIKDIQKTDDVALVGAASTKSKRKKKKGKKKDSPEGGEANKAVAESTGGVVDVASIMKSKSKTKEKSAAEIASSTAAKEAKVKKEAAAKTAKKQKKKKKDKYAHGAPSR
uniref:Uncharacterized protein n=1 Tax=Eucampia antarctica TaxID=49252 RepID=A0A7S2R2H4_9STRA|mmetsp:Transcript_1442/g.1373  ORF Transcript_1442/g.1373 Transcript_1442/m.1373 type:complete len:255 (+) Transcript_1442:374-1138(+)|eukprot:CAMPEP_0197824260 /NCGR_PEP_ID=MMETSP1437-20131217/1527_1 /TAXON_ID=49252 ORGANISM="Eucampia antarctica, Strain CCMP1452" /NCGR_SAMPLE_ID=MMETSP1437 /ASSEMBLY_ACC=CAM_ASM_001096 /LENGTH=254 /DNA_ID=CAMNT_0043423809 /DNA_START=576 /DNA_END=1340 /DNA_ORIENTATION=+